MIQHGRTGLEPRAWLCWGLAASLPPLLGRNPFVLAATLLAIMGVRAATLPPSALPGTRAWSGIVRLAVVLAAVGVLFNVLTAHVGDRPFAYLPEVLPVVGGPLTVNALAYGFLSGVALLTLVLVGTSLGAALDWPALARLLPARLATFAVAGAVAWAFVPQTVVALREIREAQAARGYRARGVRDLVPLLVPLLAGGLERAVTLAEALESRAFATPVERFEGPPGRRSWRAVLVATGLTAAALGAYLLAAEALYLALPVLGASVATLAVAGSQPRNRSRRTRYRPIPWSKADSLVVVAALIAMTATLATLAMDPAALRYEPYPSLTPPRVNLGVLAALALLLAPVLAVPQPPVDSLPRENRGGLHEGWTS